jgi:hypothetical protein
MSQPSELGLAGITQRTQIRLDHAPHELLIHVIVLMAEDIPEPAHIDPRNGRIPVVHIHAQLDGSLTDPPEAPFNSIASDPTGRELPGVHPSHIIPNPIDVLDDVAQSLRRIRARHDSPRLERANGVALRRRLDV